MYQENCCKVKKLKLTTQSIPKCVPSTDNDIYRFFDINIAIIPKILWPGCLSPIEIQYL